MPEIHATSSAVVAAPAPIVYGLIADYHQGHPSILPPKYFQNLQVEEGGVGAGTRISFQMQSFGGVRRAGLAGWLERWLAPRFLRAVFAAELRELGVQAMARTSRPAPA